MKKIYTVVSIVVGTMIVFAQPVLAEEGARAQQVIGQNHLDSIHGRITRLDREIAKGTNVYSPEELKALQKERDEFKRIWDYVNNNEPSDSL